MDLHTCTVQHAGLLDMQIVKEEVTAAELALLRQIHGEPHVVNIVKNRQDKRKHRAEYDRLVYVYGPAAVARCFPGNPAMMRLPTNMIEAGIVELGVSPDDEPEPEEDADVVASIPADVTAKAVRAARSLA